MVLIAFRVLLPMLLFLQLTACAPPVETAPVINKAPYRKIPAATVVQPGDSIYKISWEHGLDFIDIARWNGLKKPYRLQPGQTLQLRRGSSQSAPKTPVDSGTGASSPPRKDGVKGPVLVPSPPTPAISTPPMPKPTSVAAAPPPREKLPAQPPSVWRWPARGEIIARYSQDKGINGIRIAGSPGSPVWSTAGGEVVYAGEGLRGYGKLVIVKHSDTHLSAYAHNRRILVAEGDRIGAGQQIAEMGSTGANRTMLHFEIRVNGKPQDPLGFLRS